MSIVDALSKAKKVAQQARVHEVAAPLAADTTAISAGVQRAAHDRVPAAAPAPIPSIDPIQPILVEADISVCQKHRLLVPGSEELLDPKVESAYRMLRTRLLQRSRNNGWMTIGVTSACPDDGKTLTALNLALSLAKEKNNGIVLIDLDMRNPSVFKCLGIAPPNHILEYFEDSLAPRELFVSIGVDNLVLAGGAQTSQKSSELLSNGKFETLMEYVRGSVTKPLVVIDLPPVLSTDDALVLAPRLDAILIVTSEGKTARADLQRAVDTLAEFRIAGFVLNRSQDAVKGYGYY